MDSETEIHLAHSQDTLPPKQVEMRLCPYGCYRSPVCTCNEECMDRRLLNNARRTKWNSTSALKEYFSQARSVSSALYACFCFAALHANRKQPTPLTQKRIQQLTGTKHANVIAMARKAVANGFLYSKEIHNRRFYTLTPKTLAIMRIILESTLEVA